MVVNEIVEINQNLPQISPQLSDPNKLLCLRAGCHAICDYATQVPVGLAKLISARNHVYNQPVSVQPKDSVVCGCCDMPTY